jgi:hypothetical protein
MNEEEIEALARKVFNSVRGGSRRLILQGWPFSFCACLSSPSPRNSGGAAIAELERGFHQAIAAGVARAGQRDVPKQ